MLQNAITLTASARQTAEWLDEVRVKANRLTLGLLYAAALAYVGSPASFRQPSQYLWLALLTFAIIGVAWLAARRSARTAGAVLGAGTLGLIILTAGWAGFTPALVLLIVPVGLAGFSLGFPVQAALATAVTGTLILLPPSFPAPSDLRVLSAAAVWVVVGMVWLMSESLLQAVHWAWAHYEQSEMLLAQSRQQRAELAETVDDLRAANVQMARLNRLAQSLRQAAEDERRAKEQFVANVSHELRTPLNMIIGFCEMITNAPETYNAASGGRVPPALLADLNIVLRNSRHLSELIDDVLDLSQIEAGRMALTKERVSLAEIIDSAAIAVRPLMASKHLALAVDVADDLPLVFCDRTRIREVVLNLLSNAARFTERGGVTIQARQEGEDIVVSVADTGPGISEEDGKRLFQPFEQLDASIRRRHGGTGLGLSISKGFVELHDGRIWVESRRGAGTTFYFSLPINPPAPLGMTATRWLNPYEPYEERSRPSRLEAETPRPRYVLVETGNELKRLLERYLDQVEVKAVPDLAAAVADLAHTPAQALLINDVHMGEALEGLTGSGVLPYNVPAIVCAVPGTEQAAEVTGVRGYLVKPISREALLGALDGLERPVRKILIVDDEPDALQLFSRMLSETTRGYRVMRAANGKQALQLLAHEPPDVILLDLVMPEMDGFQLLARLRTNPALADIPTILISARDPQGQPIVSNGIAATSLHGLSVQQLLAAIQSLTAVLAQGSPLSPSLPLSEVKLPPSTDPASPAAPRASPASG
jgi:signal transduction histidine kinase/CheY-like chemotaxis protein